MLNKRTIVFTCSLFLNIVYEIEKHNFYLFNFILITIQAQVIKGEVRASVTKESLPYVNMALLMENYGTTTNEFGNYILDVKNKINDTLLVSYLGYAVKKIPLNKFDKNKEYELNITLEEEKQEIDEIIVAVKKARYTTRKKIGQKKKRKYP